MQQRRGLIVQLTALAAEAYSDNVAYRVSKSTVNRMSAAPAQMLLRVGGAVAWKGAYMAGHSEEWDLWYPKGGATGIPFARGRIGQPAEAMLVHAAPQVLTVTVRGEDGAPLAAGVDLEATGDTPIARLTRRGDTIVREDIWPGEGDIGRLVILPGGEVGTLVQWWHSDDRSEWRWRIELYNHR